MLSELKKKNPSLKLYDVRSSAFSRYGRVIDAENGSELIAALKRTRMPESGNTYRASVPSLESCEASKAFSESVFGGIPTQSGYCNGHGHTLNALEYPKCAEINATPTGLVLLLALPEDLRDDTLDSSAVKGFYLPADVFVEIHPRVLHFAPCAVSPDGFRCLVVLEKHTNEPIPHVDTGAFGEQKLLWMRNKWMVCHRDSPQAEKGAFVGITGENIVLNY